ncbi:hypothetical protein B194_0413 [Serratia plymuthica A30]|nr:hypothetical protein B194_0413 [Serratia plymuthica A30]
MEGLQRRQKQQSHQLAYQVDGFEIVYDPTTSGCCRVRHKLTHYIIMGGYLDHQYRYIHRSANKLYFLYVLHGQT